MRQLAEWARAKVSGAQTVSSITEGPGWLHRVRVSSSDGWVITEQVRTVSADRFRRYAPEIALAADELNEVRQVLAQMLIA